MRNIFLSLVLLIECTLTTVLPAQWKSLNGPSGFNAKEHLSIFDKGIGGFSIVSTNDQNQFLISDDYLTKSVFYTFTTKLPSSKIYVDTIFNNLMPIISSDGDWYFVDLFDIYSKDTLSYETNEDFNSFMKSSQFYFYNRAGKPDSWLVCKNNDSLYIVDFRPITNGSPKFKKINITDTTVKRKDYSINNYAPLNPKANNIKVKFADETHMPYRIMQLYAMEINNQTEFFYLSFKSSAYQWIKLSLNVLPSQPIKKVVYYDTYDKTTKNTNFKICLFSSDSLFLYSNNLSDNSLLSPTNNSFNLHHKQKLTVPLVDSMFQLQYPVIVNGRNYSLDTGKSWIPVPVPENITINSFSYSRSGFEFGANNYSHNITYATNEGFLCFADTFKVSKWYNKPINHATVNTLCSVQSGLYCLYNNTLKRYVSSKNEWQDEATPSRGLFRSGYPTVLAQRNDVLFIGTSLGDIYRKNLSTNKWDTVLKRNPLTPTEKKAITAISAVNNNTILASTQDAILQSTDLGSTWMQIGTNVSNVSNFVSFFDTLYAVVPIANSSEKQGVYKSIDKGVSWQLVSATLQGAIHSLISHSGLLYTATSKGLFVSSNGGSSWQLCSSPLPDNQQNIKVVVSAGTDIVFSTDSAVYAYNPSNAQVKKLPGEQANKPASSFSFYNNVLYAGLVGNSVWKYDPASVEVLENQTEFVPDIVLYPNPVSDLLTIQLTNTQNSIASIKIFDLFGTELPNISRSLDSHVGSQVIAIDIANLTAGAYTIVITDANKTSFFKKFIKI